jgi:hypothetical protein
VVAQPVPEPEERGIFQDSEVTMGGMKHGEKRVVVRLLYLRLK